MKIGQINSSQSFKSRNSTIRFAEDMTIMKYLNKFSTKELQEKIPMLIIKNSRRNV